MGWGFSVEKNNRKVSINIDDEDFYDAFESTDDEIECVITLYRKFDFCEEYLFSGVKQIKVPFKYKDWDDKIEKEFSIFLNDYILNNELIKDELFIKANTYRKYINVCERHALKSKSKTMVSEYKENRERYLKYLKTSFKEGFLNSVIANNFRLIMYRNK